MERYLWLMLGWHLGSGMCFLLWFSIDNEKWKQYTILGKLKVSLIMLVWELPFIVAMFQKD